jgi:hypothetical protein
MTPEERRAASEALLRAHDIRVNPYLPMIESEDEAELRTEDEVWRRMVALWGVTGTAMLRENDYFKEYFSIGERRGWLSGDEDAFLFNDAPAEQDVIRFSWRLEALVFLAWCAGLVDTLPLPAQQSSASAFLPLYPAHLEDADRLRAAIRLRSKAEILDWSDRLYRIHWAVRDAELNKHTPPPGIDAGVVMEWHHAVNWMTCYDEREEWDSVTTDT